MSYALTVKSQVTVPKAIRRHLQVGPGQKIDFEPLPDGSVRIVAVRDPFQENVFRKWRGTGILKMPTEEILRETRGDECMR
jgi:antitoxin PrlF